MATGAFLGWLKRMLLASGSLINLGLSGFWLLIAQMLRQFVFRYQKPFTLRCKHSRFRLLCRPNTSDFAVFRQIFLKRQYRGLDVVQRPSLIVDCGANVGYSAAYFLTRFPEATLIAVEPDPENCAILEANLAPFAGRYRIFRCAVWSRETGLTWDETPYRDGREWARMVRPLRPGESPLLAGTTIPVLLRESHAERISILKVDIERSERVLFSENSGEWLGRVDNLVVELHDDECASAFSEAIADQGFAVCNCGELTICRRLEREPTTGGSLMRADTHSERISAA